MPGLTLGTALPLCLILAWAWYACRVDHSRETDGEWADRQW